MFISRKHIPRRTFLRGAGVTLSLPLLSSMVPALTALAQTAARPRVRLGFCFMPHGAVMANWTPATEGPLRLPILARSRHTRTRSWSSATWLRRWPARKMATTAAITHAARRCF